MKLSILLPGLFWPDEPDVEALYKEARFPHLSRIIKRCNVSYLNYCYSDYVYSCQYPLRGNNLVQTSLAQMHLAQTSLQTSLAHKIAKEHNIAEYPYFLLASPTHLRTDGVRLLISEPELLQLNTDEVMLIQNAINQHFSGEIQLYPITDELWLLGTTLDLSELQFHPLIDILGQNIDPYLARGTIGVKLNALLNEIQMLLFNLPLNSERVNEGLITINSLWLWDTPLNPNISAQFKHVYISNPNLKINNISISDIPNDLEDIILENSLLIIDKLHAAYSLHDHYSWLTMIAQLDTTLGAYITDKLHKNKIHQLDLLLPVGKKMVKLSLKNLDKYKFWKNTSLAHISKNHI